MVTLSRPTSKKNQRFVNEKYHTRVNSYSHGGAVRFVENIFQVRQGGRGLNTRCCLRMPI